MCGRCRGLMTVESLSGMTTLNAFRASWQVRCINCGNVEDMVIRLNRLEPGLPSIAPSRKIAVRM